MVVDKKFWILTKEQHSSWAEIFCKRLQKDMERQFDKGASKKGELNLFTDEREFGLIPQGSEPYFELVDVLNYSCGFGVEKKRRHDQVKKGIVK